MEIEEIGVEEEDNEGKNRKQSKENRKMKDIKEK